MTSVLTKKAQATGESLIHISLILTCHKEGLLLHRTLLGVGRTCRYANSRGLNVEVVVVADNASAETTAVLSRSEHYLRGIAHTIKSATQGDAGLSRNLAVLTARGKYIAVLDGDDFFSENWLYTAFEFAERSNEKLILHPEILVTFGRVNAWRYFLNQGSRGCDIQQIIYHNYWSALSFAPRKAFLDIPYQLAKAGSAFGFEDWHWNCETIAKGWSHRIVPDTCHFVRLKRHESRNLLHEAATATIRPSSLFDDEKIYAFDEQSYVTLQKRKRRYDLLVTRPVRYLSESTFWLGKFIGYTILWPVVKTLPDAIAKPATAGIGRSKKFLHRLSGKGGRETAMPGWVVREATCISVIEPALYPDQDFLRRCPRIFSECPSNEPGLIYSRLLNLLPRERYKTALLMDSENDWDAFLFLAKSGGAGNLGIIPGHAVVLFTRQPEESGKPRGERLNYTRDGFDVIRLGHICSSLTSDQLHTVALRRLLQSGFKDIVILGGQLGSDLIADSARALSSVARLTAAISGKNACHEQLDSDFLEAVFTSFTSLESIIVEDDTAKEKLLEIFGWESEKLDTYDATIEASALRHQRTKQLTNEAPNQKTN